MEVHFAPETEQKLHELAAQGGSEAADQLIRDAVETYFEELARTRETLDTRYDDLKSGKVRLIPGDEAIEYFRQKSAARRAQSGS
jgi:predicted DNA-binding protein